MDKDVKLIGLVPGFVVIVVGHKLEQAVEPLLGDRLVLVREGHIKVGEELVWSDRGVHLTPDLLQLSPEHQGRVHLAEDVARPGFSPTMLLQKHHW